MRRKLTVAALTATFMLGLAGCSNDDCGPKPTATPSTAKPPTSKPPTSEPPTSRPPTSPVPTSDQPSSGPASPPIEGTDN
ncbi:hypothetical protein ACFVFJ_44480 [Streptomyces sp. NPDC057717]|uniref:hypothetical protein n=1 Tax=Streptomyces sp. NPDC057717 TaxID=3346224 RepID=UPI0036BB0560